MGTPYIALIAATAAEGTTYIQPGGIAFNITALLVGLLLGGLLACILAVLFHSLVGRFFRTLISFRAFTRENSRTLAELGFSKNAILRRALRSRQSLVRKLVTVVLPDGTVLSPLHSRDDDLADAEAAASAIHAEEYPIVRAEDGKDTAEARAAREQGGPPPAEAPAVGVYRTEPDPPFDPATATYYLDDRHRRRAEIRFSGRGNDARFLIPAVVVFVILAATMPIYIPYFVELLDAVIVKILGG